MTIAPWPQILADVSAAVKGALRDRPRIARAGLVRWARAEARRACDAERLTHRCAKDVDELVDAALKELASPP